MFMPFVAELERVHNQLIDPPEKVIVIESDHNVESLLIQRRDRSVQMFDLSEIKIKGTFQANSPLSAPTFRQ